MRKKLLLSIIIILILILIVGSILVIGNDKLEIRQIRSQKQLEKIYEGRTSGFSEVLINIVAMPFSLFGSGFGTYSGAVNESASAQSSGWSPSFDVQSSSSGVGSVLDSNILGTTEGSTASAGSSSTSKDYSTTNVQVENVDEADITKTDGDYIYSISEDKVVITNALDPENVKIESKISIKEGAIPSDLILYKDKLVVIATNIGTSSSRYYNTVVEIFDITNKENPKSLKNYKLYEPYYTSRGIGSKIYIISSGYLRKEDNKVITYYEENGNRLEIGFDNMHYLKEIETKTQTLISVVDLEKIDEPITIQSYLFDISNAYVSENNIYLLKQVYEYGESEITPLKNLFGIKGVFGLNDDYYYTSDSNSGYCTNIYKFNILSDGQIEFDKKTQVEGRTINQFSVDEYESNLRVALYDHNGTRVVVFNDKLEEIGRTNNLAKGETMYSSRFIGNKAYLVTYKTVDPLFVIDLSDPTNPKSLGELKIPGYSTYLHPYDENHIIGIGMETEERINRNSNGTVTSTSSTIIGMKMALFDVSDVNNPIQISSTVIGDRRTTSAILTNHKALLFSKEKELIAIPVNNYAEDFEITSSQSQMQSQSNTINSYTSYSKNYISEGYLVYKINIEEGFVNKGMITHEVEKTRNNYSYYYNSKLLRGIYIDENLFTISETAVKVNKLSDLSLISEIKIKGENENGR